MFFTVGWSYVNICRESICVLFCVASNTQYILPSDLCLIISEKEGLMSQICQFIEIQSGSPVIVFTRWHDTWSDFTLIIDQEIMRYYLHRYNTCISIYWMGCREMCCSNSLCVFCILWSIFQLATPIPGLIEYYHGLKWQSWTIFAQGWGCNRYEGS